MTCDRLLREFHCYLLQRTVRGEGKFSPGCQAGSRPTKEARVETDERTDRGGIDSRVAKKALAGWRRGKSGKEVGLYTAAKNPRRRCAPANFSSSAFAGSRGSRSGSRERGRPPAPARRAPPQSSDKPDPLAKFPRCKYGTRKRRGRLHHRLRRSTLLDRQASRKKEKTTRLPCSQGQSLFKKSLHIYVPT